MTALNMTVFKLKIIAITTMLIDHIGAAVLWPILQDAYVITPLLINSYMLTRYIGRIAFPIFAYLIANGCRHTKSIGMYMLRLGFLAIISEPVFDIAFRRAAGINFLRDTNIFYTLFLGVAAVVIFENVRKWLKKLGEMSGQLIPANILAFLAALPMLMFAFMLGSDYSHIGVGLIFVLYIISPKIHPETPPKSHPETHPKSHPETRPDNRVASVAVMAIGMLLLYFGNWIMLIFSLIAVALIAIYNGKPGLYNQKIKWGFYFFYPVHLAALIAVRAIF